jgi:hypothetical protein
MRMMLRWTSPVEKGNQAVKDGSLEMTVKWLLEELKPEAAYFFPDDGKRAGQVVFDMADQSQIPQIAERLFQALDATVEFVPVMNPDDLRKGLEKAKS